MSDVQASTTQRVASGDNLIGHVLTAGTLGGALSGLTVWLLQLAHIPPPAIVDQSITVICMVAASWLMQKTLGATT